VGDFVKITAGPYSATGVVDEFGLRMTTVRDIDGDLHFVPNGAIIGVDKFTGGYVSYNVEAVLDATRAEKATDAIVEIARDIGAHQPHLLSTPIAQVAEGFAGQSVVRLRLHVVPSQDWVAEAVASRLAKGLATALRLKEEPETTCYTIDEATAEGYSGTVIVEED